MCWWSIQVILIIFQVSVHRRSWSEWRLRFRYTLRCQKVPGWRVDWEDPQLFESLFESRECVHLPGQLLSFGGSPWIAGSLLWSDSAPVADCVPFWTILPNDTWVFVSNPADVPADHSRDRCVQSLWTLGKTEMCWESTGWDSKEHEGAPRESSLPPTSTSTWAGAVLIHSSQIRSTQHRGGECRVPTSLGQTGERCRTTTNAIPCNCP